MKKNLFILLSVIAVIFFSCANQGSGKVKIGLDATITGTTQICPHVWGAATTAKFNGQPVTIVYQSEEARQDSGTRIYIDSGYTHGTKEYFTKGKNWRVN